MKSRDTFKESKKEGKEKGDKGKNRELDTTIEEETALEEVVTSDDGSLPQMTWVC